MTTNKNTKPFRKRVILKYALIIKEYFDLMNQSETLNVLTNKNPSVYIGMNAIHRVFEFVLIKMNNADYAYYYSQKAYFYYLEYMEQIYKSELTSSLNHMDAILFVYKKTIFDMYNGETNDTSSTITNIMSLTNVTMTVSEKEISELFNNISNFTKTLFFWENTAITFENRITICDKYLHRFLHRTESTDLIHSYLENMQQKADIHYAKYDELLHELLNRVEKTKKGFNNYDKSEMFLTKFYIEEHIFQQKFKEETTQELVKWLFVSP
jgi:PHD/YefM family antitoxin component YafN of YafNO toxin-antitoxin module